MLRRIVLAVGALAVIGALVPASALTLAVKQALGPPGWVLLLRPDLQADFSRGAAWRGTGTGGGSVAPVESVLSITRATPAGATVTDLLPSSPAGFAYARFVPNQLVRSPNIGALIFEARTNQLFNSTAPATQTTGSLANGVYTLWVNGSGSATMSAGTATGCGTGVATQGVPVNFTTTGAAGTCTVTVAGSLNAFQLELGTFGTSLIVTAGATATRAVDTVTVNGMPFQTDLSMVVSAIPHALLTYATNQIIYTLRVGGSEFRISRQPTDGLFKLAMNYNGGSILNYNGAALAQNTKFGAALAVSGANFSYSLNGAAVASGTINGTPIPPSTTISVGHVTGVQQANMSMSRLAAWLSTRVPNGFLVGASAP